MKIHLTGEKATLLITLYAKALESRSPDSILRDHFAESVVRQIDHDFGALRLHPDSAVGLALRAKWLDVWTSEFLAEHPAATVLNLGCGLDSRVFRVDPPAGIHWFDVDYPDVIALRRQLYPDRDGYRMIGSSVTAPDWLAEIPVDQPAMIVAEGLLPYLREAEVLQLLQRLTARLPRGRLAFDGYSRLGVRLLGLYPPIRVTGATLHWGIDDPRELEAQVPRLRFVREAAAFDQADIARFSWSGRVVLRAWQQFPWMQRLGRLLRYEF